MPEVGEIHWYAILSYRVYGLLLHSLSASGVSVVCRAPWGPRIKHPAALVAKRCPRAWECGRRLRRGSTRVPLVLATEKYLLFRDAVSGYFLSLVAKRAV